MVSICVPTYNGRTHLKECIDSIRAQTFQDFEAVICDDQSSDGTLDYARELAQGDNRFRFIPNPHRFGLVGNWNNCVQQARGEWIKFVFQDDIIMPSCLEKLLAACQRENKLFGFCERDFIFEEGSGLSAQSFTRHKQGLRSDYEATPAMSPEQATCLIVKDLWLNPVGEPTVTLINRKLFQELGGFDEALIQMCDADFWLRVMIHYGAVFVPESLAKFRIHISATTARNNAKREFRMKALDPLLLQYKFVFNKVFKPARKLQFVRKGLMALCWQCVNGAAWAFSQARHSNQSGEDVLLKEWKAVTSHYPGLQALAHIGRGIGFLRRIKNGIKPGFSQQPHK